MDLPHQPPSDSTPASQAAEETGERPPSGAAGASFSPLKLLLFLAAAVVLGPLVGGAAVAIENQFAPLLLFPLLVGAVLGGMLFVALRVTQTAHAATATLGVVVAALLAIAAQHYLPYLRSEQRSRNRSSHRAPSWGAMSRRKRSANTSNGPPRLGANCGGAIDCTAARCG